MCWYHLKISDMQNTAKKIAPNVGLEPTTLRLRVSCSTDWASRATRFFLIFWITNVRKLSIRSEFLLHCITLEKKYSTGPENQVLFATGAKTFLDRHKERKKKRNADKKVVPPVRIELTTFRLWDWRAAYCAKEASAGLTHVRGYLSYFFLCELTHCEVTNFRTVLNFELLYFWKKCEI